MKNIGIILGILLILSHAPVARAEAEQHHELTPQLTLYTGDSLRAFILGGFQYTYRFTPILWVGVDFMGGTLSVDEPNGLNLQKGDQFFGLGGTIYFNVPALLGVSKTKAQEGLLADLYSSVGGGNLWIGRYTEPYGFIGGGLVLHTPIRWLAFRFDLKGLFYRLSNSEGGGFAADMVLNLGPSFTF